MPSSILGRLNYVDMGNIAKVSKADTASTFRVEGFWHTQTLKMEAACISETSATLATFTQCNYPRTELTSIVKHCECLKSIIGYCASFAQRARKEYNKGMVRADPLSICAIVST
jgi:hypothetical protein